MSDALLAIDIGSSRLKAALFTTDGDCTSRLTLDLRGAAYVDIEETLATAVASLGAQAAAGRREIRGLGLAAQMANLLLLDRRLRPVAEFWSRPGEPDQTAWDEMAEDARARGVDLHQRTGCPRDGDYPGPKVVRWLRDSGPRPPGGVARVGDLKARLLWYLTGAFVTDPATAAATALFDQAARDWLQLPGYPSRSEYPTVADPASVIGTLQSAAARRLGVPRGIPVIVGTGDGPAMSLGAGIERRHEALLSLGTTAVLRWPERRWRDLEAGEFRQPLGRDWLCGVRMAADRDLSPLVRKLEEVSSREGLEGVQVTGGAAKGTDLAPFERSGLLLVGSRCDDATLGTASLIRAALGAGSSGRATRRESLNHDTFATPKELARERRP